MNRPTAEPSSQTLLTRIALELKQNRELPDILRVVLEGFKDLVGAEKALFAVCDQGGRIQQAVVQGLDWSGDLDDLPMSRTIVREALNEDGPILLADALSDQLYAARASIRQNALRMIVALPVKGPNGLIGILYADSPTNAQASNFAEILDTLDALTTMVSLILENARLYAEQRFRARYLSRLAHDLRGHLHGAVLNADYLVASQQPQDADEFEAQRYLELSLNEMQRLLANSSNVTEQSRYALSERIPLLSVLQAVTRLTPPLAREHRLSVVLDAPISLPDIYGWSDHLQTVLDNLLSNALKFAAAGSTITISARPTGARCPDGVTRHTTGDAAFLFAQLRPLVPDPAEGFVEICVHNTGPVIAPEMMPRLFEAYACEGGQRRGLRSTGLGLSIVAEAVERIGGRVWARSTTADGTAFSFTLPCALQEV